MNRILIAAFFLGALVAAATGQEQSQESVQEPTQGPTQEEINAAKFAAYKARRKARREYALAARRAYNAGKVHRYWTAISTPVNPLGVPAIQQGLIRQPPIPVAPRWGWGRTGLDDPQVIIIYTDEDQ